MSKFKILRLSVFALLLASATSALAEEAQPLTQEEAQAEVQSFTISDILKPQYELGINLNAGRLTHTDANGSNINRIVLVYSVYDAGAGNAGCSSGLTPTSTATITGTARNFSQNTTLTINGSSIYKILIALGNPLASDVRCLKVTASGTNIAVYNLALSSANGLSIPAPVPGFNITCNTDTAVCTSNDEVPVYGSDFH